MSRTGVTFTLQFVVDDVRRFVRAARERAISEGIEPQDARETYTARDLGACAVMLFDPGSVEGVEIHGSDAETYAI